MLLPRHDVEGFRKAEKPMTHARRVRPADNQSAESIRRLPVWGVNAARRLAQFTRPGVYEVCLVVEAGGVRKLVIDGREEVLG